MRLPLSWLRDHVDPGAEPDELSQVLTRLGIEVENIETPAADLGGILVGEILAMTPHPSADRLSLLKVDVGREHPLQIVCGARNMKTGDKVALAPVGTRLPNGMLIRRARIRGEESFGMCCSEEELGLAEASDGIMILDSAAKVGESVADLLGLEEAVFELSITPNRGDCMSVRGLARELAAYFGKPLMRPEIPSITPDPAIPVPEVKLIDADCPLYLACRIEGIRVKDSPGWLQKRLKNAGMRPVNGVVDVLNYIMLDMGQPMHAFDADRISGEICVRGAQAGERFIALDGSELQLDNEDLLVADREGGIALAGVMGSLASGVHSGTSNLVLEAAVFAPERVSLSARRHHLVSDASMRFERGIDASGVQEAMNMACAMVTEMFGGKAGKVAVCGDADRVVRKTSVRLDVEKMHARLGVSIPDSVDEVLERMGFGINRRDDHIVIEVPCHRNDVRIPEDMMEEYARIFGYERIPDRLPNRPMAVCIPPDHKAMQAAVSVGYQQVISYAFISRKMQAPFAPDDKADVCLSNPISQDMSVMRRSPWPGMLAVARYNMNRQQDGVALTEQGRIYAWEGGKIREDDIQAWLLAGERQSAQWFHAPRDADFFDLKGDLETWFQMMGHELCLVADDQLPGLQPGQSARLFAEKREVGRMGKVSVDVTAAFDLDVDVFVAQVLLNELPQPEIPHFAPLPEFPSVSRDLVFLFPRQARVEDILRAARKSVGNLLAEVRIFDRYVGEGVPEDQVSLGLRFTLQAADRTLTQADADQAAEAVITAMGKNFNATLRG